EQEEDARAPWQEAYSRPERRRPGAHPPPLVRDDARAPAMRGLHVAEDLAWQGRVARLELESDDRRLALLQPRVRAPGRHDVEASLAEQMESRLRIEESLDLAGGLGLDDHSGTHALRAGKNRGVFRIEARCPRSIVMTTSGSSTSAGSWLT